MGPKPVDNEHSESEIEMMEIDDQERQMSGKAEVDKEFDILGDEENLRVGDDAAMSNDSEEERSPQEVKPTFVGEKRQRSELGEDEDEDMDFEAIENEMKKQKLV